MKLDLSKAHSVLIYFNYKSDSLEPLFDLEHKLRTVINKTEAGIFDGHEFATDDVMTTLFMYGHNAETLFKTIKPILDSTPFMKGATAHLRFGPAKKGVSEIEVEI